jgi:hypothetical protein
MPASTQLAVTRPNVNDARCLALFAWRPAVLVLTSGQL